MADYKTEVTLNEKDTLSDLLIAEKNLVKAYALAITEGCSQGYRTAIKNHLMLQITDQIDVFFLMTELDYYRVHSADECEILKLKEKFSPIKNELC